MSSSPVPDLPSSAEPSDQVEAAEDSIPKSRSRSAAKPTKPAKAATEKRVRASKEKAPKEKAPKEKAPKEKVPKKKSPKEEGSPVAGHPSWKDIIRVSPLL